MCLLTLKAIPSRLIEVTAVSRGARRPVSLAGHRPPAAGFEAPFEMLATCHERMERTLDLQARLQQHLLDTGCDDAARQAARDVMRYFDIAAPLHHQDEELHVFPPLLAGPDLALHRLVERLVQEHRAMEHAWIAARGVLDAIASSAASSWQPLDQSHIAALTQFSSLYRAHLDAENDVAYPAAQAALPAHAVLAMSQDMMQRRGVKPIAL